MWDGDEKCAEWTDVMTPFFMTPRDLPVKFRKDHVMTTLLTTIFGTATGRSFTWNTQGHKVQLQPHQLFLSVDELARELDVPPSTLKDKLRVLRKLGVISWRVVKGAGRFLGRVVSILPWRGEKCEPVVEPVVEETFEAHEEQGFHENENVSPSWSPSTKQDEQKDEPLHTPPPYGACDMPPPPPPPPAEPPVPAGLELEIGLLCKEAEDRLQPENGVTRLDEAKFMNACLGIHGYKGSLDEVKKGIETLATCPWVGPTKNVNRVFSAREAERDPKVRELGIKALRLVQEAHRQGASPSQMTAALMRLSRGLDPGKVEAYVLRTFRVL